MCVYHGVDHALSAAVRDSAGDGTHDFLTRDNGFPDGIFTPAMDLTLAAA
jgi:hypothetical protein